MPFNTVPINENIAEDMRYIMLDKNIDEVEMKEHASDKIMDSLGF